MSSTARHLHAVADVESGDGGDRVDPLVPDGAYDVVFVEHWTGLGFGKQPLVMMRFRIVTLGEHGRANRSTSAGC